MAISRSKKQLALNKVDTFTPSLNGHAHSQPVRPDELNTPPSPPQLPIGPSLVIDSIAATVGAGSAAHLLYAIDFSIAESSTGRNLFKLIRFNTFTNLRHPIRTMRNPKWRLVFFTYVITYLSLNAIDTLRPTLKSWYNIFRVAFPTITNSAASIFKDAYFAREVAKQTGKETKYPPAKAYMSWGARDVITSFVGFYLTVKAADWLSDTTGIKKETARDITQITLPAAAQAVTTPLHQLGYDLNNHRTSTWGERWSRMGGNTLPTIFTRIIRIGVSYGTGIRVNERTRNWLRSLIATRLNQSEEKAPPNITPIEEPNEWDHTFYSNDLFSPGINPFWTRRPPLAKLPTFRSYRHNYAQTSRFFRGIPHNTNRAPSPITVPPPKKPIITEELASKFEKYLFDAFDPV